MSKQTETEGNLHREPNSSGEPLITFKMKYTRLDLLYFLYLYVVIPCITLFFIGTFAFKLNATLYYIFASAEIVLYTSVLFIDLARDHRPIILPMQKNMHIHILQSGFIYVNRNKEEVVLWDQIVQVRYDGTETNSIYDLSPKLRVWRNDGKKFIFNANLTNFNTLANLVVREYNKHKPQTMANIMNQYHES
jgi:hypothetical protein